MCPGPNQNPSSKKYERHIHVTMTKCLHTKFPHQYFEEKCAPALIKTLLLNPSHGSNPALIITRTLRTRFVWGHFVFRDFVSGHFVRGHFVWGHFVWGHFRPTTRPVHCRKRLSLDAVPLLFQEAELVRTESQGSSDVENVQAQYRKVGALRSNQ